MDISNKIKARRKELGLTQQQVAERVFVTRQTISKWELGKSRPNLVSLKLLNNALEMSVTENRKYNKKGVFLMDHKLSLKDIIFTLVFGIVFLPIRILCILDIKYKNSKILKLIVKPVLIILFLVYMRSLNFKAFITVGSTFLLFYIILNTYYSET